MRLHATHTTRYLYPSHATLSYNEARLQPLSDETQTCYDFRMSVSPNTLVHSYDSPTGRVHYFDIVAPHDNLTVIAESLVETHRHNPFVHLEWFNDDTAFYLSDTLRRTHFDDLQPTSRTPFSEATAQFAACARLQAKESIASFLIALTRLLHREFAYVPGSTHVHTPLERFVEQRRGVCQDFAHLMIAICRQQGIPSRYVSGYLYTGNTPLDEGLEFDSLEREWLDAVEIPHHTSETFLVGGDATHAWVECLLPNGVWVGFDPTNNIVVDAHYIKVHTGRDYNDAMPLHGVYWGGSTKTLEVSVRVVAVVEKMTA